MDTCFVNTRGLTCAEYDSTATVERNDECIYDYECVGADDENVVCCLFCENPEDLILMYEQS